MDIIETLRGVRRNGTWNMLKPRGNEAHPICQKAAAELEATRLSLTTARAEAEGLREEVEKLREVERLTRIARRDYWFNDCPEYEDRDDLWQDIDDALQAIDKSRAALTKTRND